MALSDLSITSDRNTDKIVYESGPLTYVVSNSTTPTNTVTNPYGAKCFSTLKWSIDNSNFYPANAIVSASNPYTANIWCDNSLVYLYFENFSGSSKTFYLEFALDTIA